jgi:type VI secretion system secreted protein VgrG
MDTRADTTQLTLTIGSLPQDTFKVVEFHGNESISACFSFTVKTVSTDNNIGYEDVVGKPASLSVYFSDFMMPHHGIVKEITQFPSMGEGASYEILIVPRLNLLQFSTQNRIFQNKTAVEIIAEVLKDAGFSNSDYRDETKGKLTKREFTVQYNETNLNFIQRLMEHEGIFYFFDHADGSDVLVMGDANSSAKQIPNTPELIYHPEVGMFKETGESVFELNRKNRMVTGKVTLKDYNYRTPESNVMGQAVKKGEGEFYQYSDNLKNTDEAGRIATLRAEMFTADKIRIAGKSDCRSLKSGFRFTLKDGSGSNYDGDYILTSVIHNASQEAAVSGSGSAPTYVNSFECIPSETPFRPRLTAAKPVINGVLTARVDGQEGAYAFLDEQGRYRVKFPFDLTSVSDGKASCSVRMGQPYSGSNYGHHFPVHKGAEIIIGFENGDIDRPIGLSSAPNPSTSSPVNSKNKSEHIIRTASGHQLRMDDLEKKTVVEVISSGKHSLTMDDEKDKKGVQVKTTDGNTMKMDDKNENITLATTKDNNTIKLDNKGKAISIQTSYGHQIKMDDNSKSIAVQTKDGNIVNLDDSKKLVTLKDAKSKHIIQIDGGGNKISISTKGDMELAAKGKLNIQAKEITMQAKQGGIDLKAMKDVKADGMNINMKGKQKIQLEGGMDVGIKGNMNLKLEGGMKVESKAGLSNKMTGVMVNAEASALNTIKGAMVMIN